MTEAETAGRADPALFTPVRAGRVSELVVAQVRRIIVDGQLRPGERLPAERELAERFGVSRVTVRDALRVLEAQGLVQIRVGARGGAFVTAPTSRKVGEGIHTMLRLETVTPEAVAEARLVMELGTVALAVAAATADDLSRLLDVCDRAEQALAAGRYDVALSAEFHATLAAAAHNGAIHLITESFRGPLSMAAARAREPAEDAHRRSVAEHRLLVQAIAARDGERAQRIMAAHLLRGTAVGQSAVTAVLQAAHHRAAAVGGRRGAES